MGAWKSSDGGSLHKVGSSSYSGAPTGTQDIVTAAGNAKGVIIWTAMIEAAGDGHKGTLLVGGTSILAARYVAAGGTPNIALLQHPYFVDPGIAVSARADFGNPTIDVTYEILS